MDYIIEATQSFNNKYFWRNNLSSYSLSGLSPSAGECVGVSGFTINAEVNIYLMITTTQQDVSLLQNVISSLLRNRKFLGYQLSFYKRNLTKEQFDTVKKEYLIPNNVYDVNILAHNVYSLIKNTDLYFDADEISTMFQCDIDVAEEVLTKIENSLTI